jgi:DNA polymerase-3 subunit epsilon
MRPPADVPITARDQHTGITVALLAEARSAAMVMAGLDRHVGEPAAAAGDTVLLVAHSASTERSLIHGKREHCPGLAATPLLDTVRLARASLPGLTEHGLSQVAGFFGITLPVDRHRALADVELTIQVLRELIERGPWSTLLDLERDAYLPPKTPDAPTVEQIGLFCEVPPGEWTPF